MLGYVDPNSLGLPLQTLGPWLAAAAGAALAWLLMSWRLVLAMFHLLMNWLWRWRLAAAILVLLLCIGIGAYATLRSGEARVGARTPGGAAIAGAAAALEGKDQTMPRNANSELSMVVLGMDGLDPDLLNALMDAGELPAFEKLKRGGAYGRLATTTPPESPVVWSTFATGRDPGGHGIFDFIHRRADEYTLDVSLTERRDSGSGYVNARQGVPFWAELAEAGVPTEVLFAACSFPPAPEAHNVLAGMGTPDLRGNLGQYTLISSDPTWAERDLSARILGVARPRGTVRFSLPGPRLGRSELTIDAKLQPGGDGATARLKFGGTEQGLTVGQWSPWVPLTFKRTLGRTIHGIGRFYLKSLSPDLNLYVTPMQFDPAHPVFDISRPGGFSKELADRLGRPFATLGLPIDTKAYEDGVLDAGAFQQMAADIVQERRELLMASLERNRSGLVFCYFGAPDPIQHMFWEDFLKERLAEQGVFAIPQPIRSFYKKMDAIVADVHAELADRPEARLLVLSDHGFADFRRAVEINRVLLDLGYLHLADGQGKGRPLFQDVDWSQTRAYACGFSSVFINLKGREGEGIVDANEKASLIEQIQSDLLAYMDPDTDERPFAAVRIASHIYGDASPAHQPDLVLGMRPGYRASWVTALGGVASEAVSDNRRKWRGGHIVRASDVPGIVLSSEKSEDLPRHIQAVGAYVREQFQQRTEHANVAEAR